MFGFGRYNAAVVGTGYMAAKMAAVLNASPAVRPYAVVSRDLDRALSFGRENGFKKAYDSMEAMLADHKVDLVYIATPASEHAGQVRLCIEAGKPVLCETPIALTAAEAESLFSLSSSLDVLVVEAMHIRFLPFFGQIVSVISSGAIGTPVMLTANMAADIENLPRLQRPSLGGGALGDMGYFLLNFSSMIFGDRVKRIQSSCAFTSVRVDRQLSIVLQYKDDRMAVLSCTTRGNGESRAVIQGTKGYMVIEDLKNFASATVYDTRRVKTAAYKRGKQKSEFEFEMAAFAATQVDGHQFISKAVEQGAAAEREEEASAIRDEETAGREEEGLSPEEEPISTEEEPISTEEEPLSPVEDPFLAEEESVSPEEETVSTEEGTLSPEEETGNPETENAGPAEEPESLTRRRARYQDLKK